MKRKKCDICKQEFVSGLEVQARHKRFDPWWRNKVYICGKCENTLRMMVLKQRGEDDHRKIFQ